MREWTPTERCAVCEATEGPFIQLPLKLPVQLKVEIRIDAETVRAAGPEDLTLPACEDRERCMLTAAFKKAVRTSDAQVQRQKGPADTPS